MLPGFLSTLNSSLLQNWDKRGDMAWDSTSLTLCLVSRRSRSKEWPYADRSGPNMQIVGWEVVLYVQMDAAPHASSAQPQSHNFIHTVLTSRKSKTNPKLFHQSTVQGLGRRLDLVPTYPCVKLLTNRISTTALKDWSQSQVRKKVSRCWELQHGKSILSYADTLT